MRVRLLSASGPFSLLLWAPSHAPTRPSFNISLSSFRIFFLPSGYHPFSLFLEHTHPTTRRTFPFTTALLPFSSLVQFFFFFISPRFFSLSFSRLLVPFLWQCISYIFSVQYNSTSSSLGSSLGGVSSVLFSKLLASHNNQCHTRKIETHNEQTFPSFLTAHDLTWRRRVHLTSGGWTLFQWSHKTTTPYVIDNTFGLTPDDWMKRSQEREPTTRRPKG